MIRRDLCTRRGGLRTCPCVLQSLSAGGHLVRLLGSEALGRPLATRYFGSDHRYLSSPTVIGIVEDFHFRSLHPSRIIRMALWRPCASLRRMSPESWLAIVRAAAAVAIGVPCLGAFSLTALAAARRRKEIGIRKAVGATTRQVLAVFTGEFAKLVGCLVAVPLSYLALDRWLQEFAYRVEPGLIHFATAGAVVTALVLAVVTSQAMRAGLANPTDLLRHE